MDIGYTISPKKSTLNEQKKIFLVSLYKKSKDNVNGGNPEGENFIANCIKNDVIRQISK